MTRGFNCANCGAAVELRALTHTQSVACTSCAAILDPRDPNVHILQTAALKERVTPRIPLGARGTWHGHPYDVVGFQRRSIEVDGERYWWDEYVLFNPYRGFRYLSEYQGHWNDIRTVRELIEPDFAHPRARVDYRDGQYQHFQRALARTDFVLGEFPWTVRAGDEVEVNDFVSPPFMLSSEHTGDEVTWSHGTYTPGAAIWQAFGLPGEPPPPVGVFANQPSPFAGRGRAAWRTFGMLAAILAAVFLWRQGTAGRELVFEQAYTMSSDVAPQETAFVTPPFTFSGPGNVEFQFETDVNNNWIGFDLALINEATGEAWNATKEIEYYTGVDEDGTWSEGDRKGRLVLRPVPAGQYYLRVEPESPVRGTRYTLRVRRDVPALLPYAMAFLILLVPLVWAWMVEAGFEHRRMAESDYPTSAGSSDDEDDED